MAVAIEGEMFQDAHLATSIPTARSIFLIPKIDGG
jgi:hypothetical protein